MTIDGIKKIAVIGAGTMGQGIAQLCASSGYTVMLYDVQPELTRAAISNIRKNLELNLEKGRITSDRRDSTISKIEAIGDFRMLQVDLVIEAVIEKVDIKQKIFSELEKINGQDCILLSNTSSISITQIASALKYPSRFAGLHFFNPAPVMKLVEIVRGIATDDSTVNTLKAFSLKISKSAVLTKDSPGFIVNRVARHFYTESLRLLEDNVSDFKNVDILMKSTGFKMGPFELMDLIGIDINYSVTSSMYNAFHQDTKFRPSRIQQQKIEAGFLGRKSGKGFYSYTT
ncbi:3-hydroxyacyl-CoA dehydrogenase NAD-binding domain-containing protein [Ohtaekwangia koreensis]|uniref:3-hydroxybutyryl-CoA dehydrogenase n=1 Tax=Ohtaekwangia koreensis TaxID=688867 RepID=A0A1T5IGM8_9BACT|nr:3-hydroxyacyl-CoA dehydrogenase NAD-binding domain-containing protein [Ohtaekwangia koreensis]SKC38314.1 3-hydroxybutyryl-CoA dehydrogenase [Ohtaekwangia koreensis]